MALHLDGRDIDSLFFSERAEDQPMRRIALVSMRGLPRALIVLQL